MLVCLLNGREITYGYIPGRLGTLRHHRHAVVYGPSRFSSSLTEQAGVGMSEAIWLAKAEETGILWFILLQKVRRIPLHRCFSFSSEPYLQEDLYRTTPFFSESLKNLLEPVTKSKAIYFCCGC